MKRTMLYFVITTVVIPFILPRLTFADGKFLIFATPQERVADDPLRAKEPLFLVDSISPYATATGTDALREQEKDRKNVLPSNLISENSREYRFPIPAPTERIKDFGIEIPSRYRALKSKSPAAPAQVAPDENLVELEAFQLEEEADADADADVTGENTSARFNVKLWNEVFSGTVACDSPQLAHDLKEYSRSLTTSNSAAKNDKLRARYFHSALQQVVVAWNGKSDRTGMETIIVSSSAVSSNQRSNAMLSVIPLPGAPVAVERVDNLAFSKVKTTFQDKAKVGSVGSVTTPTTSKTLGSHNIFVWELDSVDDLLSQVNSYIVQKYSDRAAVLVTPEIVRVVEYYFQRGFRYFAFDLAEVSGVVSEKETIAYTFHSTRAYYPLVISRIGGESTNSTVDLIVMTPDDIKLTGAITRVVRDGRRPDINKGEATLVSGGSVDFTIDDVRNLEPSLASVFDTDVRTVKVRNVRFTGSLDSFKKDFTANVVAAPAVVAKSNAASRDEQDSTKAEDSTETHEEQVATPDETGNEKIDETSQEKPAESSVGAETDSQTETESTVNNSEASAPASTTPGSSAPVPETENNVTSDPENK